MEKAVLAAEQTVAERLLPEEMPCRTQAAVVVLHRIMLLAVLAVRASL